MTTLRDYGLQSDAAIGSPEATQFLLSMKPAGTNTGTINSDNLISSPTPEITTPVNSPTPDISNIITTSPSTASTSPVPTNDFNARLEELTNKLAGRPVAETIRVNEAIAPYEKQINELNQQIEANKIQALTFKNRAEKMNVLEPFAQGDEARAIRANAVETMRLSSLAQAAQGNATFAEKQAKLSILTEFAPLEQQLAAARQNIINNYDSFAPAQKKRADIALATLNEKDAFLVRQKADREESLKIATTAAANSANFKPTADYPTVNSALQAIQNSDSQKALQISIQTGLNASNITKQTQNTVFNLAQTYPDANILPTDTLQIAQNKAANSSSFIAKQSMTRAVIDPNTGQITYYASRGPNQPTFNQFTPISSTQTIMTIPLEIKPALENVLDIQYLDQGKLTTGQLPKANKIASMLNIPVLSKGDADEVQKALATYNSAKALMQTIIEKSNKLITAQSAIQVPQQYITLKAGATLKTNSDAAVFQNTVKAFSSMLTRAAGEKGVLTNIDVQRIINALPNFTDTQTIAQGKAQSLDSLFLGQIKGAIQAYVGSSLPSKTGGGNLNQASQDILNKYGIK